MTALLLIVSLFVVSLSVSAGLAYACLRSAVWFTCRRG
jgi:hypothetical protein